MKINWGFVLFLISCLALMLFGLAVHFAQKATSAPAPSPPPTCDCRCRCVIEGPDEPPQSRPEW